MDDLSSVDWSSKPKAAQAPPNLSFPSLQPSPSPFGSASGRSTPASIQGSNSQFAKPPPHKPTQDSFSNLVNFGSAKPAQSLTLAERQAQLEAEKRKKEEDKRKLTEAQFGTGLQWETLGTGTSSPALRQPSPAKDILQDDKDLFAAFNKDTVVDKSSHFPPPSENKTSTNTSTAHLDLTSPSAWGTASQDMANTFADDDDPFGLSELKSNGQKPSFGANTTNQGDDDDFLGDLGKPVEEVRKNRAATKKEPEPGKPIEDDSSSSDEEQTQRTAQGKRPANGNGDPFDKAVAQLVAYGFAPEDARRGILESGAGTDVQAAANWLLDDAHRKSKAKAQGKSDERERGGRSSQQPRAEPDFAKSAAAVGSSLFKTANSLWKTGQKKMQQAVSDFQGDGGNPNQPKWMRDAQADSARQVATPSDNVTNEAMMLETDLRPKPSRNDSHQSAPQHSRTASPATSSTSQSRNSPAPRWQQQPAAPSLVSGAKSKLSRFNADDDDFSTYVSANRRRKPATSEVKKEEPDLLFNTNSKQTSAVPVRPAQPPAHPTRKQPTPTPVPLRQVQPTRQIPSVSPSDLQASTKYRLEGTAHFKRGDFAMAHTLYSQSIASLPSTHPLVVILLTNRALTALKTGEPKQAVSDADQAIKVIGPGYGHCETVAVVGENNKNEQRDMRELYGKALSRKAEALEQMEKWADAGAVWKTCVEAGLGGPTAIKGRQRCEAALAPKPKPVPKPAAKPAPRPTPSASLAPQKSSEAVTRMREANKAAAKEDDEKFALTDKVDARISAWRDGKRDNLRALISSLDKVLWENSGWKTVGLHELVMANKVKISYMKAIAKTHPDKVRTVLG